jgi:hypothetical protein
VLGRYPELSLKDAREQVRQDRAQIERVLTRIVAGGAPTVANDALRYMSRMFRMAVRNHWIDRNPAADFDLVDAGARTARNRQQRCC